MYTLTIIPPSPLLKSIICIIISQNNLQDIDGINFAGIHKSQGMTSDFDENFRQNAVVDLIYDRE